MKDKLAQATIEYETFVELLRARALEEPETRVLTFLADGEEESAHLTYGELDRQARAVGALLQRYNARGERVLLLYPPGLDYVVAFLGCLYAGAVAVPTYPPKLNQSLLPLRAIMSDAQAKFVLTTSLILSYVENLESQGSNSNVPTWLATDCIAEGLQKDWQLPDSITGDTLAFLQYTSGSTAAPKGVMLTHSNLLHNLSLISFLSEHSGGIIGVSWAPPHHGMGMIKGVLEPLYVGGLTILMCPMSFLQEPVRWLRAISRYQATLSGGPNFAYDLCVRKITPEQKATLDLSSWSLAFTGGEAVRQETLKRFATMFEPCGFRWQAFHPGYGLTEATLIVSGFPKSASPTIKTVQAKALENNRVIEAHTDSKYTCTLVGCGRNLPSQKIIIAHPESLTECQPGEVGEIWVSGPSVARGYWNRPDETERTFRAYLADTAEGPFLRTGDLGFLERGELFITGRLKDLIIIAGRNHYPQDIERTTEQSHPSLQAGSCAAFSVEIDGEERLVVLAEVDSHYDDMDRDEVAAAIRQVIAECHGLQVYAALLLKAGSIPRTANGRIQRHACRVGFQAGSLQVI